MPLEKIERMYDSVMEKVAENKVKEDSAKVKSEETIAKKVERLRDSKPHDILEAKIQQSVKAAMDRQYHKKSNTKTQQRSPKKEIKLDGSIDYGAAYSMIVSDNTHLLPQAIAPPGLEPHFRPAQPSKDRDKSSKGNGKGKGKEKGKGKGKSKSPGKSKGGKKGEKKGAQHGGKKGEGKGKKGRPNSKR